jgi:hypothetical protein
VLRGQLGIVAARGTGYWLGIAGMGCVGLLLLYPLRKRLPSIGFMGSVPVWFHLHMALGLVAPTLILFHADFRVGSANAGIALGSMLVVAGSGLLGRLLYVRVHRGLSGQKSEARAILSEAAILRSTFGEDFGDVVEIARKLEQEMTPPKPNLLSAWIAAGSAGARIGAARRQMLHAVRSAARLTAMRRGQQISRIQRRKAEGLVRSYCKTLSRAANLAVFERLFGLWHVAHLPLFGVMVIAAVIHIVAVHLY